MGGNRFFISCFLVILLMSFSLNVFAKETLSGLNLEGFEQESEKKLSWRKNPFVQPADDIAVSDLKLTGIIYSDYDTAALISGRVVREGDKIGYTEVLDIEKGRVILRNENGIFSLLLGGGIK